MDNFWFQFPCESHSQYFEKEKFEFLHKWHRTECKECFQRVLEQTAKKLNLSPQQFEEFKIKFFSEYEKTE